MIEERRYSKRELARLYWPETKNIKSALKNLRQDIKGCPELVAALQRLSRAGGSAAAYTVEREPPQLFRRAGAPDPEVPLRAVDGKKAVP